MVRRVFIGDIHGDIRELERVLAELNVVEDDEVVFLGDYIDRGENSKAVLDRLIQFKEEFPNTQFLWGNHDLSMYLWLTESSPVFVDSIYGIETLRDLIEDDSIYTQMGEIYKEIDGELRDITYEVKERIKEEYGEFFGWLEYHVEFEEHIAVHGGLNFATEDPIQDTSNNSKVYIRGFIEGSPLGKVMVIGHTSVDEVVFTSDEKIIAVDTGCGIGGKLSALVYFKGLDLYVNEQGEAVRKLG